MRNWREDTQDSLFPALEEAEIGHWDWNIAANESHFSPEWKRQLGYDTADWNGGFSDWETRLHPEDRDAVLALLNEFLTGRSAVFHTEYRIRHKDGSYRRMAARASRQTTPGGKPVRLVLFHLDVTSHSQQLAGIFERVSDAFVALDKDWRYVYLNHQAAALFGRRQQDLIGKHIWTEFPEGLEQPFHRAYEKAMAEQTFVKLETYYEPWHRWFENRIYPSPDGLAIFFHEVTDRVEAQHAAKQSGQLLEGQNRVLELIAKGLPLSETLDTLLRLIDSQSPGMLSSILILERDGVHVQHAAAPNLPPEFTAAVNGQPIGPAAGSCGTAIFRREPVIVEDIAADPLWENYRDLAAQHGLRACWSTPIFDAHGRVLGSFALYFRKPGRPTPYHLRLIEMATATAAIAIAQNRETRALRASEERLRLAVAGGNFGIWEWHAACDSLEASDRLKEIFHWPPDAQALTLQTFIDAVHPDDRAGFRQSLSELTAAQPDLDIHFRIAPSGRDVRWVAVNGKAAFDAEGRPLRVVGVARDITARKSAEEEGRRREAQLAEAEHIAGLGSYEWDVAHNSVYRSEELFRIFGLRHGEFEPTLEGYLRHVHPEDRDRTRALVERALRERAPFEFDERIIRPDGAIRWVHSQGKWILDSHGTAVKLMGICRDITERKAAEDELRRSEERFQFVARVTNDAIWDWDLATGSVWWNGGISTLFQYRSGEVEPSMDWKRQHVHPDDLTKVLNSVEAVIAEGEQFWSGEFRFQRADGTYADVLDRGFVLYDDAGKPLRIIGTMTDISERKRTVETLEQRVAARTSELQTKNEELEREIAQRLRTEELLRAKNDELKAFAYTVSHDLKAPLRGITGYAQELDRTHRAGLDERALFCLNQILTAARNLDRLIEDLLHYSRLDAESPTFGDVDLARLVETILSDRKPVISEYGAIVTVDLASKTVHSWERGLTQILTNLIDNALKYSRGAKPPRIQIASRRLTDGTEISIADNGIGFDMKYHDRIFGLFNRLVRQEEFEGTGAGLAIARKVAEKLGARILADAKPGSGATFFLKLPAESAPPAKEIL